MKTKRTFKSVIAMLLAVILSFSTMSAAFAVNIGDEIEWPYDRTYEFTDEYIYKGELAEGTNVIKEDDAEYCEVCYTLEVEKSGFYLFTYGDEFAMSISDKTVNGLPVDYADTISSFKYENDTAENRILAYLEAGTTFIGMYYYSNYIDEKLDIEFISEELADFEIDEASLQNLIIDYDFGYGSYLGFDLKRDVKLVFADGKEMLFEDAYIRFIAEGAGGEAVEGENNVTVNLFGLEKQYKLTCYHADYFIKSVEISNLDKYLKAYKYYYPGDYGYDIYGTEDDPDGIQGEVATVTLNDGSKVTAEIYLYEPIVVALENGSEIYLFYGEAEVDGKLCFAVTTFGETIFLKEEIEVVEATDKQNLERLGERIDITLTCMVNNAEYWIHVIMNPDQYPYYTTTEAVFRLIDGIFSKLSGFFGEIRDCFTSILLF